MRTLETVLDPLFAAMANLPAVVGLAIVSLVVTVLLLVTFKWTSNQRALTRARKGAGAALLELRLFQDDPVLVGRAFGTLLLQQGRYLRYAFVPLLWLALPLLVLFAHLDAWYARATLTPGAPAIVIAKIDNVAPRARPSLAMDAASGVRVETPAVWSPATREAVWRIRATRPGAHVLRARADGYDLPHIVHVGDRLARLDDPGIDYPPRQFHIAGLSLSWLPVFLALTLLFTLLLRPAFRVAL